MRPMRKKGIISVLYEFFVQIFRINFNLGKKIISNSNKEKSAMHIQKYFKINFSG
jgi:hypothetical protein